MRPIFAATVVAVLASSTANVFAAETMGMSTPAPMSMSKGYSFQLVGPAPSKAGKSVVSIRIIRAMDKKPVIGAIFIQSRADMAPIGMAMMNAPIKSLPSAKPGIYSFEVQNGSVWKKADKWSLTFSVKIQGEMATVRGSVVVVLKP